MSTVYIPQFIVDLIYSGILQDCNCIYIMPYAKMFSA